MYIIIFKYHYRDPHPALDTYGKLETFDTYEKAVEVAELACENDPKREWYFDYKIFALATS